MHRLGHRGQDGHDNQQQQPDKHDQVFTCFRKSFTKPIITREAAGELQPLLHSTSDSMLRKLVVASDTTIDMDAAQVSDTTIDTDLAQVNSSTSRLDKFMNNMTWR